MRLSAWDDAPEQDRPDREHAEGETVIERQQDQSKQAQGGFVGHSLKRAEVSHREGDRCPGIGAVRQDAVQIGCGKDAGEEARRREAARVAPAPLSGEQREPYPGRGDRAQADPDR